MNWKKNEKTNLKKSLVLNSNSKTHPLLLMLFAFALN